jgi:membrane protease YdiL (CAAX protease family)
VKTRIVQDDPDSSRPATGQTALTVRDGGPRVPPGVRRFVGHHRLAVFFALSYLIGWALLPFGTFLPCSPLIAALVVAPLADGVAGLRAWGARLFRWRVGWVWYAVALVVPLLVHGVAVGLNMAAGAPAPSTSQFSPWYGMLAALGLSLVNPLEGPLGEEPGWRGYAQPLLQGSRSPLAAGAILAVLVTGWHLPLVFMPQFDLTLPDIASTLVVTFWYVWLFNRSGAAVVIPLLAHSTEGLVDTRALWSAGADAAREQWTWLIAWSLLVAVLLIADRPAWRSAPAAAIEPAWEPPSQRPESVAGSSERRTS